MIKGNGKAEVLEVVTNDAAPSIDMLVPYSVEVELEGTSSMFFHRWSCEDVAAKSKAGKGSTSSKTDNLESYIWRNDAGQICIPGEYLRMAMVNIGKFRKDPRRPRAQAVELYKAGIIVLSELAPVMGPNGPVTDWDYVDQRRAVIQRAAITRNRPAFRAGWKATFEIQVLVPDLIGTQYLLEIINDAGKFSGLADQRPTYGRFQVNSFNVQGY